MSDVTQTVHSRLVIVALHACKAALAGAVRIRRVTSVNERRGIRQEAGSRVSFSRIGFAGRCTMDALSSGISG